MSGNAKWGKDGIFKLKRQYFLEEGNYVRDWEIRSSSSLLTVSLTGFALWISSPAEDWNVGVRIVVFK
jgi:hypothetical protein